MNILFSGGGTLGSVTPLLALVPTLQKHGHHMTFVGTSKGPERALVMQYGIPFLTISAPKFRRYISWKYMLLPIECVRSMVQAHRILRVTRPDIHVSAGGYVSVPLAWAGKKHGIPTIIHQQDARVGLAARLMQNTAAYITLAFDDIRTAFPNRTTQWIGNPVRTLNVVTNEFVFSDNFPVVLIMGGGTGAQAINECISSDLFEYAHVIHVTGKGKKSLLIQHPRYHAVEFLTDAMGEALHRATIVVGRAGVGTIFECAMLFKPYICIPLPHSPQEENANLLAHRDAAIILLQHNLTSQTLCDTIIHLLNDAKQQEILARNIHQLYLPESIETFIRLIESCHKQV